MRVICVKIVTRIFNIINWWMFLIARDISSKCLYLKKFVQVFTFVGKDNLVQYTRIFNASQASCWWPLFWDRCLPADTKLRHKIMTWIIGDHRETLFVRSSGFIEKYVDTRRRTFKSFRDSRCGNYVGWDTGKNIILFYSTIRSIETVQFILFHSKLILYHYSFYFAE